MRYPHFRFYPDDFCAGTVDMTPTEVGAYIRLLCYQWNRGSIPVETEKQQRIAGCEVPKDVLAKFQIGEDGQLRNARMESERAKTLEYIALQQKKGLASAAARSQKFNRGSISVPTEGATESQPTINHQPSTIKYTQNTLVNSPRFSEATKILGHLNAGANKGFRSIETHLALIQARFSEANDMEGILAMIDRQCKLWLGTPMEEYLRPATLFSKTKFHQYYDARNNPIPQNGTNSPNHKPTVGESRNQAIGTPESRALWQQQFNERLKSQGVSGMGG